MCVCVCVRERDLESEFGMELVELRAEIRKVFQRLFTGEPLHIGSGEIRDRDTLSWSVIPMLQLHIQCDKKIQKKKKGTEKKRERDFDNNSAITRSEPNRKTIGHIIGGRRTLKREREEKVRKEGKKEGRKEGRH